MDAARFDRLSQGLARRLARPLSRRAALRAGGVGALALGAGTARAAAQPASPEATPAADERAPVAFLLVQVAEGGSFSPTGAPEVYDLELLHAGGMTLAFADRPDRVVRLLPTAEALAAIGFTPVPPNAALVTGPADGEVVVVLELLDGRYDAAAGTLTYRARALAEVDRPALAAAIEARAVVAPPARFGHASLFVDSGPIGMVYGACPDVPCDAGQTCCPNGVCCDAGQTCCDDGTCC